MYKHRCSEIRKKQKNGLAGLCDADGRRKNTQKRTSRNQWVGETEEDQGKDGLRTLKKIYR
jgi:hypothetical protein